MRITQIPIYRDNFSYLIVDEDSGTAAVIDPAEAKAVLSVIAEAGVTLTHILCTHHHWDHAGGNKDMLEAWPDAIVVGGSIDADQIHGCTVRVDDGDVVNIGGLEARVLFTPCHTSGHIAYLFDGALFCGDTLFVGGCGRFFEGDAAQMHHALNEVFAALPGETKVYCGHEYTIGNLEFALSVDGSNEALRSKMAWAQRQRQNDAWTVPSTIAEEKSYNPFMRVGQPAIQAATGATDPVEVMSRLREAKNNF